MMQPEATVFSGKCALMFREVFQNKPDITRQFMPGKTLYRALHGGCLKEVGTTFHLIRKIKTVFHLGCPAPHLASAIINDVHGVSMHHRDDAPTG